MIKGLSDIWAKSPEENKFKGETLAYHTHSVARKLVSFIRLRPELSEIVQEPELWHYAFWAAICHDLGKVHPGFQKQLRLLGYKWGKRHEVLSLGFLNWFFEDQLSKTYVGSAIISHHKDVDYMLEKFDYENVIYNPEDDPFPDLLKVIKPSDIEALYNWISIYPNYQIRQLNLSLYGVRELKIKKVPITSENIWDSLNFYYKFNRELEKECYNSKKVLVATILRAALMTADHLASAHQDLIDLPDLKNEENFFKYLPFDKLNLHEHQEECSKARGNTILISPTGSGKTESAMLWARNQLLLSNQTPRIFYILPFQASLNAMKQRFDKMLDGNFSSLQHGKAIHSLYSILLSNESENKENALFKARLYQSLAKLHAYPIRILTPYQVLKAFYKLKGYESVIYECFNGIFIFDELHAYEEDRLALILEMMKYIKNVCKGKIFIMTATMPKLLIDKLNEIIEFDFITASDSFFEKFNRHKLNIINSSIESREVIDRIISLSLNESKTVLVCCNTVSKAQNLYSELKFLETEGVEVILIHSRFNARDRNDKEKSIISKTEIGAKFAKPVVLISTQVVEVSLNIDLDTIITEVAPLDALIQRFGRVNRARKKGIVDVHVCINYDKASEKMYTKRLLDNSIEVLIENNSQILCESKFSELLNRIYDFEYQEYWQKKVAIAQENFHKGCIDCLRPFQSTSLKENDFNKLFNGFDILPKILQEEYQKLVEELSYIEADQLCVNVPSYRFNQLSRVATDLINRKKDDILVVNLDYGEEYGLVFQAR